MAVAEVDDIGGPHQGSAYPSRSFHDSKWLQRPLLGRRRGAAAPQAAPLHAEEKLILDGERAERFRRDIAPLPNP
jgi:hypothetical protein